VRLAAALQPDVVLLDIGGRGRGRSRSSRACAGAASGAAIVVLSGYGPERLGGVAGHVTAHLPKTTELSAVRRTVHAAAGAV
jgi:DNA-binding NarL/FixJ family response regulator